MKLLPVPTLKCLVNEVVYFRDDLLAPEDFVKEVLKCGCKALDFGIPPAINRFTTTTGLETPICRVSAWAE